MIAVISTRIEALLCPLLRKIPTDSTVVITADHGFTSTENGYSLGGDSFFEKGVPVAVWESSVDKD